MQASLKTALIAVIALSGALVGTPAVSQASQPQIETFIHSEGVTSLGVARFSFTASVEGSTFEYRVDSDDWQPCGNSLEPASGEGEHTLYVRATDPVGNVDDTPAQAKFTFYRFRPSTGEVDPPRLTKFVAKARTLKMNVENADMVEFTIEQCGWRGIQSTCVPFAVVTGDFYWDGRRTVVVPKRFRRGMKYRVHTLWYDGPFPVTTKRTVTAK